jgi:RND family efflux transporter MFP subunit
MASRLFWTGVGFVLTFVVIWQAGQADWVRPPELHGPPATGRAPGASLDRAGRPPGSVIAEGRLVAYPGAEVVLAAEIAGLIVRIPVQEKSVVRKGDTIAELKCDDLEASRAEALARIDEAEAEIGFYQREVARSRGLVTRGAASTLDLDTNERGLGIAAARRRAAIAARDRYDALIAKTRIVSPIDGVVVARLANPGESVAVAARLAVVADLTRVRVEAEVDEVDAGAVALGADATVTAEGFPGLSWRGKVEEIPDVVVGRQLRPEDPARPVDMRVLLVKIALKEPTPLKLGQRVEVEIAGPPPRGGPTRRYEAARS